MTLNTVNTKDAARGVPAFPKPAQPAHIIRDDAEAISVAKALAKDIAPGAAARDRDRIWQSRNSTLSRKAGCGPSTCPRPLADRRCPMPRSPR